MRLRAFVWASAVLSLIVTWLVRDESEKMPQEGEIDLLVDLRQFCLRQDDALAPGHLPDTTYTAAGEEVRYQRV